MHALLVANLDVLRMIMAGFFLDPYRNRIINERIWQDLNVDSVEQADRN